MFKIIIFVNLNKKSFYLIMKTKNIVLDLDNTLICTVSQKQMLKLLENEEKLVPLQYINYNFQEEAIIYLRPYLQDFLDHVFANYNVSIFTAGSSEYAYYVIQNIILNDNLNRHIDFIMSFPHYKNCFEITGKYKSIDYITSKIPNYTKHNTRILDDSPRVFESNPNITIKAEPFDVIIPSKEI
jgi:TFIIF-interacting CTD phosphatase-like protein